MKSKAEMIYRARMNELKDVTLRRVMFEAGLISRPYHPERANRVVNRCIRASILKTR